MKMLFPLALLFTFGVFSFSIAAEDFEEPLPSVEVRVSNRDPALRGAYVTVIHANAKAAAISFGTRNQVEVRRVLRQETRRIESLPFQSRFSQEQNVFDGFFARYNYVLLVLHRQSRFFWRNIDSEPEFVLPPGAENLSPKSADSQHLEVFKFSKAEIALQMLLQGSEHFVAEIN